MFNRLKLLLPLTILAGACRQDHNEKIQTELPGSYSHHTELTDSKVWETLDIGQPAGQLNEIPVVQYTRIAYRRKGKWVEKSETRKLTARYNPESGELYLVQRGKTYRVDLQRQYLLDASDTLRKVSGLKRK